MYPKIAFISLIQHRSMSGWEKCSVKELFETDPINTSTGSGDCRFRHPCCYERIQRGHQWEWKRGCSKQVQTLKVLTKRRFNKSLHFYFHAVYRLIMLHVSKAINNSPFQTRRKTRTVKIYAITPRNFYYFNMYI